MPKGFPDGFGRQNKSAAARPFRARLVAPLGAACLHGALVVLMIHFQSVREAFGQRAAVEAEWVWLPEVTLLASAPVPPAPAPEPPPASPLPPDPPPEEIPPLPVPAPEPTALPTPEPVPAPLPPPPVEIACATNRPDAWTAVRDGVVVATLLHVTIAVILVALGYYVAEKIAASDRGFVFVVTGILTVAPTLFLIALLTA